MSPSLHRQCGHSHAPSSHGRQRFGSTTSEHLILCSRFPSLVGASCLPRLVASCASNARAPITTACEPLIIRTSARFGQLPVFSTTATYQRRITSTTLPLARMAQAHDSTCKFRMTATPNHALQRTATAVTARASAAAFPPAMHGPRQPPPSLSLGSLGV